MSDVTRILDRGKQGVARFEAERQALPMMDHPNIAKMLDAGATGSPESQISADSRRRQQELIHVLRSDLDWIVMKALEKDRARCDETANQAIPTVCGRWG